MHALATMETLLGISTRARESGSPLPSLAVQWFQAVRWFRLIENERVLDRPSESDLRWHRVAASHLVAEGEALARAIRDANADLSAVGLTVDCVEAEVRLLQDGFDALHKPLPQEFAGNLIAKHYAE